MHLNEEEKMKQNIHQNTKIDKRGFNFLMIARWRSHCHHVDLSPCQISIKKLPPPIAHYCLVYRPVSKTDRDMSLFLVQSSCYEADTYTQIMYYYGFVTPTSSPGSRQVKVDVNLCRQYFICGRDYISLSHHTSFPDSIDGLIAAQIMSSLL